MCVSLVLALTGQPVKSGFPFLCDGLLLSKKKSKVQGSYGSVLVWLSTCSVAVAGDSRPNGYVCPVVAWFMEWMTTI
jgi:hypothetical protein